MNRHLVTALATVAFAASSAAFACEYSAMDDGVASLAPANASKVPVAAAACEGNGCAVKPDKLRAVAPKPAAKPVVVAVKNAAAEPQAATLR